MWDYITLNDRFYWEHTHVKSRKILRLSGLLLGGNILQFYECIGDYCFKMAHRYVSNGL